MHFRPSPRIVCAFLTVAGAVLAVDARAATLAVPAGGDLQAAINAAQPGDIITLEPGATYIGNFFLPNKGDLAQAITIRSAAADSVLPPAGVRVTPNDAASLPQIKSGNSDPALRTDLAANHWTLMFLEFQANNQGYGDLIQLGRGDASQTDLSQVPYALVVDRVYVHGDPMFGQKRCIALNSRDTTIVNSYIADCKSIQTEAQAIQGSNGPGNYLIENNYLEAAGENILFGGADPAIPNLVTGNVMVLRNHLFKPLAWRDPIAATPASVSAAGVAGAGSLPAGTYAYQVVAQVPAGEDSAAVSAPSAEVSAAVADGGAVAISWAPVPGASGYLVYGRTPGGENMFWTTAASPFIDTGSPGTPGSPGMPTTYVVKNIFELKNAQDVVIEGNVMENLWVDDQAGYPVVFTPRNQDGGAPWVVVQRVTFQHNIVRHTGGGVNILGHDHPNPSLQTNHITVRQNVFDDIGGVGFGVGAEVFLVGDSPDSVTIDHNTIVNAPIAAFASSLVFLYGETSSGGPAPITNFVYTNNMSLHNAYGISASGFAAGSSTIDAYLPNGIVLADVLAGGPASQYPAGNFFPTPAEWLANFVNPAAADYHLVAGSVYLNAGTDGTDLGPFIDEINRQTAIALSGNDSGSATIPSAPTSFRITPGS